MEDDLNISGLSQEDIEDAILAATPEQRAELELMARQQYGKYGEGSEYADPAYGAGPAEPAAQPAAVPQAAAPAPAQEGRLEIIANPAKPPREPGFFSKAFGAAKDGGRRLLDFGKDAVNWDKKDWDRDRYQMEQYQNMMMGLPYDNTALADLTNREYKLADQKLARDKMDFEIQQLSAWENNPEFNQLRTNEAKFIQNYHSAITELNSLRAANIPSNDPAYTEANARLGGAIKNLKAIYGRYKELDVPESLWNIERSDIASYENKTGEDNSGQYWHDPNLMTSLAQELYKKNKGNTITENQAKAFLQEKGYDTNSKLSYSNLLEEYNAFQKGARDDELHKINVNSANNALTAQEIAIKVQKAKAKNEELIALGIDDFKRKAYENLSRFEGKDIDETVFIEQVSPYLRTKNADGSIVSLAPSFNGATNWAIDKFTGMSNSKRKAAVKEALETLKSEGYGSKPAKQKNRDDEF